MGVSLPNPAPRGRVGGGEWVVGGWYRGCRGSWLGSGVPWAGSWCAGRVGGGAGGTAPATGRSPSAQLPQLDGENGGGEVYVHQLQVGGPASPGIPNTHKVSPVIHCELGRSGRAHSQALVLPGQLIQVWAGPQSGQCT